MKFRRQPKRIGKIVVSAVVLGCLLGIPAWFLARVVFGADNNPPMQPNATRVWDGGGADANWSTCANWDTDTCPVADDTLVFDGSAGGTPNDDSTWDSAFSVSQIASITVSSYSGTLTFTKTPVTITGAFSHTSTGAVTFTGSASISVGNDFTLTTSGTFTANTSTLTLTGTGNFNSAKTFNNVTVDSTTNDKTVTTVNNSPSMKAILTVGTGDTLSIGSGLTVTSTLVATVTINGTISGAGTLVVQNSNLGAGGTLSVATARFDVTNGSISQIGRTFGGTLDCYNNSSTTARTCTFGTAAGQTITVSGDLTLTAANTQNVTVTGATQNPTVNVGGKVDFVGTGSGAELIVSGTGQWKVTGNFDTRGPANSYTATSGNVLLLDGTNATIYADDSFYNLTIDPATTGTITVATGFTVTNTISVAASDTLSINSGLILTHTGATLTLNGTISGAGELDYYSATAFPTTGTISSALYFVASNNDQTVSARTYGGLLGFYSSSASTRTITLGTLAGQTITASAAFDLWNDGAGVLNVTGVTNSPTLNISGDISLNAGSLGAAPAVATGTGVWTVSGNVNLTGITFTATAGNTLVMNGSSKTLTSAGTTLQNVTFSGSITLANATHTIAGNLSMAGGTITAGTSTVAMTSTSATLTGGGAIVNNLTINPSSAGTVTLQTSDLTVSSLLTVETSDTLSLDTSRTLTLSGNSGTTLTLNGTISGAGRLTYQNSTTTLPTTGTLSSVVRFDTVNGNLTLPSRTYGGIVEVFNGTGSARSVTPAAGTITLPSLTVIANGTANATFSADTNNPTVNVTGDIDFTGTGDGTEVIASGTGTWTASGNVDFSAGTFTATSGNTFTMNGTGGKTINLGGNSLNNFTVDPSSSATITAQTGDGTVSGTLAVASGDTLSIDIGRTLTHSGSTLTLSGTIGGNGILVYQSSTAFPTTGTINADLRFDTTNNNQTMSTRSYGGDVELYNNSSSSNRTVTPTSGTVSFLEDLTLNAASTKNITFDADTFDPSVTIAATLDFTGTGSGSESITSGTGTWTASGNVDFSGGTFTANSGNTFVLDGSSKTLTAPNDTFSNLTITGTITTGSTSLDVNNTLTVSVGSFTAPSGTLSVAGNFTHSGGTFTANGGSVVFDGTDQTISGTTTFANLTKTVTTARTLTFQAGISQTVTGTLTLQGASGALLSLRSSTSGTQWNINPQGTRSLQYLDVKDSNNTNTTLIETQGKFMTDGGNNTGWKFLPLAPSALTGTALSSTRITWNWTDNSSNETEYRLKDANGTTVATSTANATTITETGLTKGTTYTRTIVAANAFGESSSESISVTTNAIAPNTPTLESPADGDYLATLMPAFQFIRSTDSDDGLSMYTLLFDQGSDTSQSITLSDVASGETTTLSDVTITGGADSFTATLTNDTLLSEGSHTWAVRAVDAGDNGADSSTRTFFLDITKPTVSSVTVTGTKKPVVTVSIEDSVALRQAMILLEKRVFLLGEEIDKTKVAEQTLTLSGTSETVSHEFGSLSPGSYLVTVTVEDQAGNTSTGTAQFSVTRTSTVKPEAPEEPEKGKEKEAPAVKTPSEEREEAIDRGEPVTPVPEGWTLPNLEKFAKERREREASNLQRFLDQLFPESFLVRLERVVVNFRDAVVHGIVTLGRTVGTTIAKAFGVTARQIASLREFLAESRANVNRPQFTQFEGLDKGVANVIARAAAGWQIVKEETFGFLVRARKNRSELAIENERRLEALLAPVRRVVRWIGVGARVAYHGIRGDFEDPLRISDVTFATLTATEATITWKTNRPTSGKVNWGDSIRYGHEVVFDAFETEHRAVLTPLLPNTKYYFEVLATDTDNKQTFDAYYGFTTASQ